MSVNEGDKVSWKWGNGTGAGTVRKIYKSKVTLTLKEAEVTRNASPDQPAALIEQADGDQVLKSLSELE